MGSGSVEAEPSAVTVSGAPAAVTDRRAVGAPSMVTLALAKADTYSAPSVAVSVTV